MLLVPLAAKKPVLAEVVELSQVYVYVDPLPPVGVEPVSAVGVEPEQILCAPLAVLPAIAVFTVMATAAEVSAEQAPELTTRLNQVLALNAAGE